MIAPESKYECNMDAGTDEAIRCLDQDSFQALLFNSFLGQQQRTRVSLDQEKRLIGLLALAEDLALCSNDDQLLNLAAARAVEITGATGVAIGLAYAGEVVCRASSGATAPDLGMRFSLESGLSGACFRSGITQICDDTEADPRVNRDACRALRVRSMILVPLKRAGQCFGVVEMFAPSPRTFVSSDVRALELLAGIITLSLAYLSERQVRAALEGERGAVLQVLEQITPALERALDGGQGPDAEFSAALRAGDINLSGLAALARTLAPWRKDGERKRSLR